MDSLSKDFANKDGHKAKDARQTGQIANGRSQFELLIEACKHKQLDIIKSILGQRPEYINRSDKQQRNLLHYIAILLIEDRENGDANSSYNKSIECFNYIVDRCQLRQWWQQDLDGLSVLHLAVISSNVNLVKHLIYEHPFSVKYPLVCTLDQEHHSPLHWAVITNNFRCVKLLINYAGAVLAHEPDLNGATPLHYATQASDYPRYRQQLKLMLSNFELHSKTSKQFFLASKSDRFSRTLDEFEKTRDANDFHGEEAKGISTKHRRASDITNSHQASSRSFSKQQSELDDESAGQEKNGLEILAFLVSLPKINLEVTDRDRRTPLLWASSSGNSLAVKLLLAAGANPNSCDINKLGALHCAASHGFADCLECLLNFRLDSSAALDANQPDQLGCSPLFYSVLGGNVDCIEILLDRGAKSDWQDVKLRTAAHFAALRGQLNSLKTLERRGANLWLANKQGDLPLHYAIKSGRKQVVRWLLERSPYERSVNAINNLGRAPIHLAVAKDDLEMIEFLVAWGANLNQLSKVRNKSQTNSGNLYETALDIALNRKQADCAELLQKHGALSAAQLLETRWSSIREPGEPPTHQTGNVRALFDLQSASGAAPINFDTSCSSTNCSPAGYTTDKPSGSTDIRTGIGMRAKQKMGQSAPVSFPHGDDFNRSIDLQPANGNSERQAIRSEKLRRSNTISATEDYPELDQEDIKPSTARLSSRKPFKGGMSYQNELMQASIKCKVFERQTDARKSRDNRPTVRQASLPSTEEQPQTGSRRLVTAQSAPVNGKICRSPQQEIVTNVTVYTSPCGQHCKPDNSQIGRRRAHGQAPSDSCTSDQTSSIEITPDGSEHLGDSNELDEEAKGTWWPSEKLPDLVPAADQTSNRSTSETEGQEKYRLARRAYRARMNSKQQQRHLPAILSEAEKSDRSTLNSNIQADVPMTSWLDGNQMTGGHSQQELRFLGEADKFRNMAGTRSARGRAGTPTRSPVHDYIHGSPHWKSRTATSGEKERRHHRELKRFGSPSPDYSKVQARVNSRRSPEELWPKSHLPRALSRSANSMSSLTSEQPEAGSGSLRQTPVKRSRRQVVASAELGSQVEKAIWKYRNETRLFEELQNLKRSQIRSGRANEALLVKRLIEHFRRRLSSDLVNLDHYRGPYTFKAYERYLYDQLRKLSKSNRAKLQSIRRQYIKQGDILHQDSQSDAQLARFLSTFDEDITDQAHESSMRHAHSCSPSELTSGTPDKIYTSVNPEAGSSSHEVQFETIHLEDDHSDTAIEPDAAHDAIRKESESAGSGENRSNSPFESVCSTRRSSLEVEREKLSNLPLRVESGEPSTKEAARDEARLLSSRIMLDALGNLSRACSPELEPETEANTSQDPEEQERTEPKTYESLSERVNLEEGSGQDSVPLRGRRRSVVNIGNKLETIIHDVGIEIDPAIDSPNDSDVERDISVEPRSQETKLDEIREAPENETESQSESDILGIKLVQSTEDSIREVRVEDEIEDNREAGERAQTGADQVELPVDDATQDRGQSNKGGDILNEDKHSLDSSSTDEVNLSVSKSLYENSKPLENSIDEQSKSTQKSHIMRRSSSPVSSAESMSKKSSSTKSSRRSSAFEIRRRDSEGYSTFGSDVGHSRHISKKVCNGYDLDRMRRPRLTLQHQASAQNAEPGDGIDFLTRKEFPSQSIAADSDIAQSRDSNQAELRQVKQDNKRRQRFARSRLPSRKYAPKIDVGLIELRWRPFKEAGRRELQRLDDKGYLIGHAKHLNGVAIQPSKSQPNLKGEFTRDALAEHQMFSEKDLDTTTLFENIVIIYEINKKKKWPDCQVKPNTSEASHTLINSTTSIKKNNQRMINWCHTRAIKIVDCRTLKRTLSLPESLLYSNDLLKRFEVLKL